MAILVAVIVPAFDPSLAHPAFPVCTLTATTYKAELQLYHAQLKEQAQVNIVASVGTDGKYGKFTTTTTTITHTTCVTCRWAQVGRGKQ